MNSIPASQIVSVIPGVISAGGSALDLSGLVLTSGARVPIGSVLSFPSSAAVTSYFGSSTTESAIAAIYFAGFDNSSVKPGALLFTQFPVAPVGAWLLGGSIASMSLTALQSLNGTLIITVNGVQKTSAAVNLSGATSFSNAATLLLAGFTSPGFTLTYDSVSGGFLFADTTTGAGSTLTACTGTLATALALTIATGAVLSQGAVVSAPADFMTAVVQQTTDWATFMTAFDPDGGSGSTLKKAFAVWNSTQSNRYAYACWDTDASPTTSATATTSLGYLLGPNGSNTSGTIVIHSPDYSKAAFVCGCVASLYFTQTNGRATLAYKSQAGLTADVTNVTAAANLQANGYNFYGTYATANSAFTFFYNGSISGPFKWADSYINQIWLNNGLQLALMTLLTQMKSIPYNDAGYALIAAACADPINAAVTFGAIRPGVPLSALQVAEVNTAAGVAIDSVLSSRGWYLQIVPAAAIVRGARASPPITLWYMDGGSVQTINLNSVEVQ